MTAPTPFPYEGPEHQLPYRPPRRRPVEADDREDNDTVLAAKIKAEATYKTDDPIAGWLTAAALALAVVFLLAAVTRTPNSGRVMLGCIFTGVAVCAAGWAAYAIRDRKAGA